MYSDLRKLVYKMVKNQYTSGGFPDTNNVRILSVNPKDKYHIEQIIDLDLVDDTNKRHVSFTLSIDNNNIEYRDASADASNPDYIQGYEYFISPKKDDGDDTNRAKGVLKYSNIRLDVLAITEKNKTPEMIGYYLVAYKLNSNIDDIIADKFNRLGKDYYNSKDADTVKNAIYGDITNYKILLLDNVDARTEIKYTGGVDLDIITKSKLIINNNNVINEFNSDKYDLINTRTINFTTTSSLNEEIYNDIIDNKLNADLSNIKENNGTWSNIAISGNAGDLNRYTDGTYKGKIAGITLNDIKNTYTDDETGEEKQLLALQDDLKNVETFLTEEKLCNILLYDKSVSTENDPDASDDEGIQSFSLEEPIMVVNNAPALILPKIYTSVIDGSGSFIKDEIVDKIAIDDLNDIKTKLGITSDTINIPQYISIILAWVFNAQLTPIRNTLNTNINKVGDTLSDSIDNVSDTLNDSINDVKSIINSKVIELSTLIATEISKVTTNINNTIDTVNELPKIIAGILLTTNDAIDDVATLISKINNLNGNTISDKVKSGLASVVKGIVDGLDLTDNASISDKLKEILGGSIIDNKNTSTITKPIVYDKDVITFETPILVPNVDIIF